MSLKFSIFYKIAFRVGAVLFLALGLTSCFTGIEGTKTVTLSKSDKTQMALDADEKVMEGVVSENVAEWQPGKMFFVTDPKISYILEGDSPTPLEYGSILIYKTIEKKVTPAGESVASLIFDYQGAELKYQIKKSVEEAKENFRSGQLPMLIDLDMVKQADSILKGHDYWIRTGLWYDSADNYKKGKKFSKVRVDGVVPGNESFPLKVNFTDDAGEKAYVLMNFGNSGNESRSFAHLFSLKNIRNNYPGITDEVWELIQQSKVGTGMTKEECRLALGNPSDVNQGHDYSRTLEIWQYPDGSYLQFADGILVNFRN